MMNKSELKNHFSKISDPARLWSRKEIFEEAQSNGIERKDAYNWFRTSSRDGFINRVDRGKYSFGEYSTPAPAATPAPAPAPEPVMNFKSEASVSLRSVSSVSDDEIYVPSKDATFIKWGEFSKIKKIIDSKLFFPTYIAGMSGNGKTMMVEQACAILKREYVRVQISPETDEDDLIGGFRLINGETVFQKGPVVKAMERGCILMIDEIDRATNKIMCLQGVLEGKPILLKKTGQVISPAAGFNVIATANTKGRGSDEGRYTAASIIDDAFLERFVAVVDQEYPPYATERKILLANANSFDVKDTEFIEKLVAWSNVIRKTFDAEGVDDVVSTRRLCHIVKAFSIFEDRMGAIKMCVSRFEEETREAFLDLYTKIDESTLDENGEVVGETDTAVDDVEVTVDENGKFKAPPF
jgi:MoxR-like ATPase